MYNHSYSVVSIFNFQFSIINYQLFQTLSFPIKIEMNQQNYNHIIIIMSIAVLCNQAMHKTTKRNIIQHIPPMFQSSGVLSYLGMIKQKPHYLNHFDEVYAQESCGKLEYVADWLPSYKMLWTSNPITYRLITIKNKNYFYDMDFMDAYRYNERDKMIHYMGNYCQHTHKINNDNDVE